MTSRNWWGTTSLLLVEMPCDGTLDEIIPFIIIHATLRLCASFDLQLSPVINDTTLFQDPRGGLLGRKVNKAPLPSVSIDQGDQTPLRKEVP